MRLRIALQASLLLRGHLRHLLQLHPQHQACGSGSTHGHQPPKVWPRLGDVAEVVAEAPREAEQRIPELLVVLQQCALMHGLQQTFDELVLFEGRQLLVSAKPLQRRPQLRHRPSLELLFIQSPQRLSRMDLKPRLPKTHLEDVALDSLHVRQRGALQHEPRGRLPGLAPEARQRLQVLPRQAHAREPPAEPRGARPLRERHALRRLGACGSLLQSQRRVQQRQLRPPAQAPSGGVGARDRALEGVVRVAGRTCSLLGRRVQRQVHRVCVGDRDQADHVLEPQQWHCPKATKGGGLGGGPREDQRGVPRSHVDAEAADGSELEVRSRLWREAPRAGPSREAHGIQRQGRVAEDGLHVGPLPSGVVEKGAHQLEPCVGHVGCVAGSEQGRLVERVLRDGARQHPRGALRCLTQLLHEGLVQPARQDVNEDRVGNQQNRRRPDRARASGHQHALDLLDHLGCILLGAEACGHLSQQEVGRSLDGQPRAWQQLPLRHEARVVDQLEDGALQRELHGQALLLRRHAPEVFEDVVLEPSVAPTIVAEQLQGAPKPQGGADETHGDLQRKVACRSQVDVRQAHSDRIPPFLDLFVTPYVHGPLLVALDRLHAVAWHIEAHEPGRALGLHVAGLPAQPQSCSVRPTLDGGRLQNCLEDLRQEPRVRHLAHEAARGLLELWEGHALPDAVFEVRHGIPPLRLAQTRRSRQGPLHRKQRAEGL
mmetsp:Transcript_139296/g.445352  ORF Transcript_139296/g.445352 Transcript_139296/m.445352 type:complete len:714 (-) Transcript_139296:1391-3532(-)